MRVWCAPGAEILTAGGRSIDLRLFGVRRHRAKTEISALASRRTGEDQCATGFCVDGVRCDSICNGTCMACSAAAKGSADGTAATLFGLTARQCGVTSMSSCGTVQLRRQRRSRPTGLTAPAKAQRLNGEFEGKPSDRTGPALRHCDLQPCTPVNREQAFRQMVDGDCTVGNHCNTSSQCVAIFSSTGAQHDRRKPGRQRNGRRGMVRRARARPAERGRGVDAHAFGPTMFRRYRSPSTGCCAARYSSGDGGVLFGKSVFPRQNLCQGCEQFSDWMNSGPVSAGGGDESAEMERLL